MKYDYNNIANFNHVKNKMCQTIEGCDNCPLVHCCAVQDKPTQEQIDIVQKWNDECTVETMLEHYHKLFPNTLYNTDKIPRFCPKDLGWGEDLRCVDFDCIEHCDYCWNTLYKESDEKIETNL